MRKREEKDEEDVCGVADMKWTFYGVWYRVLWTGKKGKKKEKGGCVCIEYSIGFSIEYTTCQLPCRVLVCTLY